MPWNRKAPQCNCQKCLPVDLMVFQVITMTHPIAEMNVIYVLLIQITMESKMVVV